MATAPLIMTPVPRADITRGDGRFVSEFIEGTEDEGFTDGFCRITKESFGGHAGELIRLRQWQHNVCGTVYARRRDGRLRHREALIGLPRKNGKSALGSSFGLHGLVMGSDGSEVYCLAPETRVLCLDLQWRECGSLNPGDQITGFDESPSPGCVRRFRPAVVQSAERINQPSYRITFADGRQVIASGLHRWVTRPYASSNLQRWESTADLRIGARVHDLGEPWEFDNSREAGYLAGLLDGEACLVGANSGTYRHGAVLSFAQNPGDVLDRFELGMKARGFNLKANDSKVKTCVQRNVTGTREVFRALGMLAPSRLLAKVPYWIDGIATNRLTWNTVTAIEYLGNREVVAIGTSTKTLIAEGFFSHNSCAADKEQARIVFGVARKMVEQDPQLSGEITVYKDALEYTSTGSIYKVLSSEAFTKEGLNPSTIIYDELHAAPTDELYNVMALAQGARIDPLLIIITTAGVKTDQTGQDSICYRRYQYGEKVATGEIVDPTFFMAWWGAPEGADYKDPKVWEKANPGYNDLIDPEDFTSVLGKVHENDFRTKRMNQWVNQAKAWLPQGAWTACKNDERQFTAGNRGVVLGFDGSKSGDCTGLVAVTVDTEPVVRVLGLWEKPQEAQEWRVPRAAVKDAIRQACRDYNVREIAWDEYLWLDAAEDLEDEGLPVVVFPQTLQRMGPATQRFFEMVTSKRISHDGDPRLTRHLDNAQLKTDARGSRLMKDARNSPRKIDLAVGAVMATDRAAFWLTQPMEGSYVWKDAAGNEQSKPISEIGFVW